MISHTLHILLIHPITRLNRLKFLSGSVSDTKRFVLLFFVCLFDAIGFGQPCTDISTGLIPIADLASGTYEGFTGGKYPKGKNEIPNQHFNTGLRVSGGIESLDSNGLTDPNGKIGFLVLGFSTGAMTGRSFKTICKTQPVDAKLRIVIGAQGGRDINSMTSIESDYWKVVDSSLQAERIHSNQVQVIWITTGDIFAANTPFPEHSLNQLEKYRQVLSNIKELYPNIKIVFLSDRQFAGYIGGDNGGPAELAEPTGYYSSWTVKWVIEKQINKAEGFTTKEIPFIDWGPMLWTDGAAGNDAGYTWNCDDAGKGGIHPSSKGRMKEAAKLYLFFSRHPYTNTCFLPRTHLKNTFCV